MASRDIADPRSETNCPTQIREKPAIPDTGKERLLIRYPSRSVRATMRDQATPDKARCMRVILRLPWAIDLHYEARVLMVLSNHPHSDPWKAQSNATPTRLLLNSNRRTAAALDPSCLAPGEKRFAVPYGVRPAARPQVRTHLDRTGFCMEYPVGSDL